MTVTVFAKTRTTTEGRKFNSYLSRLPRRDGSYDTVSVKFRPGEEPKDFPCNIEVNKNDANLSTKDYVNANTGEIQASKTLWVSAYTMGDPYVDHSLDEYDFY